MDEKREEPPGAASQKIHISRGIQVLAPEAADAKSGERMRFCIPEARKLIKKTKKNVKKVWYAKQGSAWYIGAVHV